MHTLRLLTIVIAIYLPITSNSIIASEDFNLWEKIRVTINDSDYTVQQLPAGELKEKVLCLWDGDNLVGFFYDEFEETSASTEQYINAFSKNFKQQSGAKNLSIRARKKFNSPQALSMKSYISDFVLDGQRNIQVIYVTKLPKHIHITIFAVIDLNKMSSTVKRADAIMYTANQK